MQGIVILVSTSKNLHGDGTHHCTIVSKLFLARSSPGGSLDSVIQSSQMSQLNHTECSIELAKVTRLSDLLKWNPEFIKPVFEIVQRELRIMAVPGSSLAQSEL